MIWKMEYLANKVNEQLLINAYWRYKQSVVNQRGKDIYDVAADTYSYMIDMWNKIGAGTLNLSLEDDGLSLQMNRAGLSQNIEHYTRFAGKTLTFSMDIDVQSLHADSELYLGIYNGVSDKKTRITTTGRQLISVTATIPDSPVRFRTVIDEWSNKGVTKVKVHAAKLELGTVSTLAATPPQDYGVELAKCQRYYCRLSDYARIRASLANANTFYFTVPIPVTLRTIPAMIGDFTVQPLAAGDQTGFTFDISHSSPGYITIRAVKTGHGLTDAILNFSNAALDANL